MPYTADKPPLPSTPEELRARIPGWGTDLDPADRPAVPREVRDLPTGAHWDLPEQQEETRPRERSIEHERLTPVFGTAAPLKGASGVVRRLAQRGGLVPGRRFGGEVRRGDAVGAEPAVALAQPAPPGEVPVPAGEGEQGGVCDLDLEAQTGTNGYMINNDGQYLSGRHLPE